MTTVQSRQEAVQMAHLLRRAGFGATPGEMDDALSKGYEKTLEPVPTGIRRLRNAFPVM